MMPERTQISIAGHFGEFLQGRIGPKGTIALVTLPCPALVCRAARVGGTFGLYQTGNRALRNADLRRLLVALGHHVRGRFRLATEMPVGVGAGSSTASRVALAIAAGENNPWRIARACLALEGASDPLMFAAPARLLWASREARVLDALPPLPKFEVLGGFFGPPQRTDPKDANFPDIGDLVQAWKASAGDLAVLASLASQSALRCLSLRGPVQDPTEALARRLGAAGFGLAHTGSARALLFAPGNIPSGAGKILQAAGFSGITRFSLTEG